MTVAELISILQTESPDYEVLIHIDDDFNLPVTDVNVSPHFGTVVLYS